VTELAISDGYTTVTVGQVIALAGVSRATFYEYFVDMEECFAAALAPIRRRLLAGIRSSVSSDRAELATFRATRELFAFASARPAMARLLLSDSLTGGGRLRSVRDEFIDDAAWVIEEAHGRAASSAVIPDLPPRLLAGASCRLLVSRLHEREPRLCGLHAELLSWIAPYEMSVADHSWSTLAALPPAPRSPFLPPLALRPPPALMPGRARAKTGALAENHWSRIVFATAEVVRRDGYAAATVARITAVAGVDARAFYRLFPSKYEALAAASGMLFRHAMAAAAGAFVAGETWPARLWEAARALIQYADENPTLTYVSLIDGHAGSSNAVRRVEELTRAFTIFLQDGFSLPSSSSTEAVAKPSEVVLDAIGMAVFELAYRHIREHGEGALSSLLAPVVYISLVPFLGAETARDFVCQHTPQAQAHLATAA
jgi:AcrR family transcriptional regulator